MGKEKNFKMVVSLALLVILVWLLSLSSSADETKEVPTEIATMCYDLCEYSKEDLYFKAPCNDIIELVRLEIDRKHFEEYISDTIDKFENDCRNFITNNLYYNLKKEEDYHMDDMTIEEFKKEEDAQMIIKYSCEVD